MTDESSDVTQGREAEAPDGGASDGGPPEAEAPDGGASDGGPPEAEAPDGRASEAETQSAIDAANEALREARARLAEVPAEVVVANHAMGLYELGAIHLSSDPPDFAGAALAIDAVACLVDGLGDRLGDDTATLRDALANIRLAFVQVKGAFGAKQTSDG